MRPPYKSALGISTGDVVTTDYGTRRYEVWGISGPRLVDRAHTHITIWTAPVVSLSLAIAEPNTWDGDPGGYAISNVRRVGDRWFDEQDDELFVERRGARPIQAGLFDPPADAESDPPAVPAYAFREGVVYPEDGFGTAWHCESCGDFNGEPTSRWGPAWCPDCHGPGIPILVMRRDGLPAGRTQSAYVRGLNRPRGTTILPPENT